MQEGRKYAPIVQEDVVRRCRSGPADAVSWYAAYGQSILHGLGESETVKLVIYYNRARYIMVSSVQLVNQSRRTNDRPSLGGRFSPRILKDVRFFKGRVYCQGVK